jgi:phenylalanyl-tRNA synthetase beta subunit
MRQKNYKSFIEGRVATINLDNKEIGILGEIHPKILKMENKNGLLQY